MAIVQTMTAKLLRRASRLRKKLLQRNIELADIGRLLDEFEIRSEEMLVVYSSWEELRLKAPPNELINVLKARLSADGCLAFPTAPFAGRLKEYLLTRPLFDVRRTPSCRGLVTEIARRRLDAFRTPQPGCPFSLIGPAAKRLAGMQKDYSSPYSEDSFLAECHRRNALILTLGLNFIQNSGVHYAEKQMNHQLGLFSGERLPYSIRLDEQIIAAESEYLFEADRDWRFIHDGYRRQASFHERELHGTSYSRIRENESFSVFCEAIRQGKIRKTSSD